MIRGSKRPGPLAGRFATGLAAVLALTHAAPSRAAITYVDRLTIQLATGLRISGEGLPGTAAGAQIVGGVFGNSTGNLDHATVWSASARNGVDLHPSAGYEYSIASATNGTRQVGYGLRIPGGANVSHALQWDGSAASLVDLHPLAGFISSRAYGIAATQEVGFATAATTNQDHALAWTGSAASAVDLHPLAGFNASYAYGTNDARQVGEGLFTSTGTTHALVWSGSAASAIDLHPAVGYVSTTALGIAPSALNTAQVVGTGTTAAKASHALLWNDALNAAVDLHPANFTYTEANATNGSLQVGDGSGPATGNQPHALFWSGTAASVFDLGALLPARFTGSYAFSIAGNTVYGEAFDSAGTHLIVWTVPEPTSLTLLAAGGLALGRRRVRAA